MNTVEDRLDNFLQNNKISKTDLFDAIHNDILETLLARICEFCKESQENYRRVKAAFHSSRNDIDTSHRIVTYITGFQLDEDDCAWMTKHIRAFFKSREKKRNPTVARTHKNKLWESQNHKCAHCGKTLSLDEFYVDHIVPFDFVGDELENNYQGLCKHCNSSKTNHVGLALKFRILSKQGVWESGKN